MVEFLRVVHSDDITLWRGNPARVEQVLVCRSAKRLLASDVILWERPIRDLKSYGIEVVGHLSGELELRELQFVLDLEIVTHVDWARLSESEILVHVPPCRQPARFLFVKLILFFQSLLQDRTHTICGKEVFDGFFNPLEFLLVLA